MSEIIFTTILAIVGLILGLGSQPFRSLNLSLSYSLGKKGSPKAALRSSLTIWSINLVVFVSLACLLRSLSLSSWASSETASYLIINLGLFGTIINLSSFRLQKSRDAQTWLTRQFNKNRAKAGTFTGDTLLGLIEALQLLSSNIGTIATIWWLSINLAASNLPVYTFLLALSLAPLLLLGSLEFGFNLAGIERLRKRYSYKIDFLSAFLSTAAAWLILAHILGAI